MDCDGFGVRILDFRFCTNFALPIRIPVVSMNEEEFKKRTKQVALSIIALVTALPKDRLADVPGKQSIGANYRAARRGKSVSDVLSKLSIVEEEADETLYWMELLTETGTVSLERLTALMAEVNEILAMTVASIKTLRARK
jgi:four helix bundle protein